MNYIMRICLLILIVGCNNQNVHKEKVKPKINKISMLISRGGRETFVVPGEQINIPDSLSDEMYLFEINNNGKMNVSYGYGVLGEINIELNSITSKDSILLTKSKYKFIQKLAQNIYINQEFATDVLSFDSWFVKLTINEKTNTYYLGESGNNNQDEFDINYLDIVDKIVHESPIKVKDYR